jgi:hypothetical protein
VAPKSLDEIWLLDPVSKIQSDSSPTSSYEILWQRRAFAYLNTDRGKQDKLFQIVFWQTIRIKVMYYRYIVQRPMVKGLSWFIMYYRRMNRLYRPKFSLEQAYMLEGGQKGLLKSYEFRAAPSSHITTLRTGVHSKLLEWLAFDKPSDTEVGCVLHIPKARGPAPETKLSSHHWLDSHLNPRNNAKQYRLSEQFNYKKESVNAICTLLEEVPLTLAFIRGIDMCSDEIGMPNWFMFKLMYPIRESGFSSSNSAKNMYPQWHVPPLRRTMHVGEDFFHLMDGLRRIEEVVNILPLENDDRIGHGLALGLSPEKWVKNHPIVWMPQEIRLWDLIWEYKKYSELMRKPFGILQFKKVLSSRKIKKRLTKIKEAIENLAHDIMGSDCTFEDICTLYDNLFDKDMLDEVGFPNGENQLPGLDQLTEINRHHYWLKTYLTDSHCFNQCYKIIEVLNEEDEIFTLDLMQEIVRKAMIKKRITVEVNPSSNFLIADLQDLEFHPLWNLFPPQKSIKNYIFKKPVNICIGSDDPIVFATSLTQEYEILLKMLINSGLSMRKSQKWLNKVREMGIEAKFTLEFGLQNSGANSLWKQLDTDLNRSSSRLN